MAKLTPSTVHGVLALGLLLPLLGCGSTPSEEAFEPELVKEMQPLPWPHSFERAALLVADTVMIEGPKGLLDHVALEQDDKLLDYQAETLPEGFRQEVKRKDPSVYVEITAALDALMITALERVVVLERPGKVPVRVVATGSAWWRSTDPAGPLSGPVERRSERLELSSSAP